jgi:hypothetical protein
MTPRCVVCGVWCVPTQVPGGEVGNYSAAAAAVCLAESRLEVPAEAQRLDPQRERLTVGLALRHAEPGEHRGEVPTRP